MQAVVIEDSKTQAQRLAGILARHGFAVRVAHDGATGLRMCREAPPDLVVSDILMPGLDGYEVCRQLKADPATRRVPVMLLTSLADPMDVVRALAAGADNFVTKPYEDALIVARVRRLVSDRREEPTVEIGGEAFRIPAQPAQILNVLVSSLEDAAARHAELEASRARLARANAQRDELMAVVAHELKTPLSTLLMRAQLAARHCDEGCVTTEEWRALADTTVKQVHRMVTIINDLQDVTHIESGGLRIERNAADLAEIAGEALERLRPSASRHTLRLVAPEPVPAHVDAARIDQVITNLLTNAVKYSPDGGIVEVRVERQGELGRVSVRDEGIGISPETRARLFERYYRTRRGQQTAQGLGLGLYVSKQLVELHGGAIGVDSAPGRGSTFWFVLPLPPASAPAG